MTPIPRRLLIHSAVLLHPTGADAWQKQTCAETQLRAVRIEPAARNIISKDNTEVTLSSVLFYDCRNSRPVDVCFHVGDKVRFCCGEYTVHSVDRLFDGARLHHLEIGLV